MIQTPMANYTAELVAHSDACFAKRLNSQKERNQGVPRRVPDPAPWHKYLIALTLGTD
jgi:hypothetical protein